MDATQHIPNDLAACQALIIEQARAIIAKAIPERSYPEQWQTDMLDELAKQQLNITIVSHPWVEEEGIDVEQVRERYDPAAWLKEC